MTVRTQRSSGTILSLRHAAHLLATTALTTPLLILPALAQNLPTGANVAAGSVSIAQPSATQMTITQSSASAVVNYNTFSIGAGHAINIQQPSVNAALLNRVTGDTPSTIAGSLTANGQVYLVNPNGIAITRSGTVNVGGGFVASTLGISDSDFMSGKRTFTGNGASAGVSNAGAIRVGRGGYAALIGGTVDNSGLIEAPLGKVGLGSGERATLDFAGDGFLQVAMPTKSGGDGALIKHSGRIKADGGSVVISAATAREAARNAINLSGHVQARSISGHSGSITIGGGAGGKVRISGKLSVASRKHKGGHVTVTGRDIALSGATINASGKTGGGSVRIGGDWQGKGDLQRADTTSVDAATTINADATASGNGGNVVVWSDLLTTFAGTVSARGGRDGGNGGDAEVSGKATLAYTGFADLSAPHGAFGTLLLDPYNVTISNDADSNHTGFTATGSDSVINVTTLQTALGGANVTVSTGAGGAQAGDITVAAPVTWSSATTLTLDAYHSIAINAPITIAGAGGLAVVTNHGGSGGTLSFAGGVQYTGSGGSLTINSQPYTLLYSMDDLQGINTDARLGGNYALAKSLDASAIPANGAGEWIPLGTSGAGTLNGGNGFSGDFTGLGNTISNLTIDIGNSSYAGLFGYSSGNISDIGLIGGSVAAGGIVGGLIGRQAGGSLTRAYATGAVSGAGYVGGLVGYQTGGSITDSYATGKVGGTGIYVGGLVGYQTGSITQAYATGAVSGASYVGGLVGWQNGGSLTQAYATGKVDGSGNLVGGLVGFQSLGVISQSYATGPVSGSNQVGGLVGYQTGSITQAYATGAVTGSTKIGGLVGYQAGNITQAYATGAVTGSTDVGGLVGYQFNGSITAGYFDSYSTGQLIGVGVGAQTGVTAITSDPGQSSAANYAYKHSAYTGLTFTATPGGSGWFMIEGQTRPFGAWEYSTTIANSHQLQLVNMDFAASYTLARNIDLADQFGRAGVTSPSAAQSAGMWNGGFVPLGAGGSFTGNFSGLGHTISNLIVDIGTATYAGLFAHSSGNISDLGLVGGSVKGGSRVGGLVGTQNGGSIARVFNTGTVTGSGHYIGGLVGVQATGSIEQGYATGAVNGVAAVGGLIGWQDGGSITLAYATGAVSGTDIYVGGLVGYQTGGSIEQAYATGLVAGTTNVGGLVGKRYGTVTFSYFDSETTGQSGPGGLTTAQLQAALQSGFDPAVWGILPGISYPYLKWRFPTGPSVVSGTAIDIAGGNGGLGLGLGINGTVVAYGHTGANGYYNFMVDPAAAGSTALVWLTGERFSGGSTASRANAVGEMPASGFAQGMASGLDLYADTVNVKTALPKYSDIATMMDRGLYGDGSGAPLFAQVPDSGVFLYDTSLCGCGASIDVSFYPGNPGPQASLRLDASAPLLTWDGAFDPNLPPRNVTILAAGDVLVTSGNGIGADDINDAGGGLVTMIVNGNLTLESDSGIGSSTGSLALTVKGDLSLNADAALLARGINAAVDGNIYLGGAPTYGVQMIGETIRLRSGGDFTMAADTHLVALGAGDALRIAVGGKFDNQTVSDPNDPLTSPLLVDPAQARWLVYLDNPTAGHNFGGLDSGNTAVWNTAAFAPVTASGNRYVFAYQPTLTFTSADATKTYGDSGAPLTYTVSGLMSGVAGAYHGDTAAMAFSGAPQLSSLGSAASATVAGGPYAITIADNGLTSAAGYVFQFASNGQLTVNPAALTITANDATKTYGQTVTFAGTEFTANGLQNGESVGSVTLTSLGAAATAGVGSSPYAVTANNATGSTFDAANYAITYVNGYLKVNPAPLTITADAQTRVEGTINPPLTYRVDGTLFNGDVLSGDLATGATLISPPGSYPITQGALTASGNYVLTYRSALLTVTPGDIKPTPLIDFGASASRVVLDSFDPIALPDNARPVFGAPNIVTSRGIGVLYADPRFDTVFVCFAGEKGTAQACFAVRS